MNKLALLLALLIVTILARAKDVALIQDTDKIDIRGGVYYQNGVRKSLRAVVKIISKSDNKEAISELNLFKERQGVGRISISFGIPLTIIGGIVTIVSTKELSEGHMASYERKFFSTLQPIGIIVFPIGIACLVNGILAKAKAPKYLKKSIYLYNQGLKIR